jgi:4-amino-4-deoxy-L-arabinose transferase-like glycosyltransferase
MRRWVAARSTAFWIVAGLTLLAAALRFATLGVQSYHHDEVVTASRILRADFWHAMDAVGFSESAPPLYYALAWVWTQVTGTGEYGLRSLSAVAGVATVPVAYAFVAELRDRRAGIAAAALVAVNPMLLWYSQEARAYALLVLFCAVSALFFVRALDRGGRREFACWGVFSALALGTHYFAVFPVAAEAIWLLRKRSARAAAPGLAIIAVAGLALAPLALQQTSAGHAEWIADHALSHRVWETIATFFVGETGDIIARPENPLTSIAPFLLGVAAVGLIFVRGDREERRRARLPLALAAAPTLVPLAIAVVSPGKDFVLARNLIPARVPRLGAVAIGVTLHGARRAGLLVGGALFVYSLVFCIVAGTTPDLQRPDWKAVAERLGKPEAPRAIVTWSLGQAPLRRYRAEGAFQAFQSERFHWLVHEIDFVSDGPVPPVPARALAPGFRQVAYEAVGGRLYIRRYALPGPALGPLKLREAREADLDFRSNAVLIDGVNAG